MRPRWFGWGPGGSDGAQPIRKGYELVLMGPSGFGSARVDSGGAHWGCWHKGPMQCPFFFVTISPSCSCTAPPLPPRRLCRQIVKSR